MIEKGHISIDILDNLVGQIIKNLGILRKNDIINEQSVNNYSEMVKRNVHSWLQWSIIEAGRELNLICVPEVKFRFLRPLNPSDFGMLNKKLRRFIKVDVAIYEKLGPKWKELVNIIKNDTDTKLILINETVFSTYP